MASKPICWIGCSIVVSGGSLSADSGTLSNPITERSSGIARPSDRATDIVSIADTSFAAKIAVGRGRRARAARAPALVGRVDLVAADADERRVDRDARPLRARWR